MEEFWHSLTWKNLESVALNILKNELLPGTTNDVICINVGDKEFPLKTNVILSCKTVG
jgi:hypothetical protein